jgi:hypothetical protein
VSDANVYEEKGAPMHLTQNKTNQAEDLSSNFAATLAGLSPQGDGLFYSHSYVLNFCSRGFLIGPF